MMSESDDGELTYTPKRRNALFVSQSSSPACDTSSLITPIIAIETSIENTVTRFVKSKPNSTYITFSIEVSVQYNDMRDKWIVERRFNEFVTFNSALMKKANELKKNSGSSDPLVNHITFPQMPQKSILSKQTPDFIQQRRVQLDYYLKLTVQSILKYERNLRHLGVNPFADSLSFYELLLYFLDIEGSSFSHFVHLKMIIPNTDLSSYRSPTGNQRRTKRKLKYEILAQQHKLLQLEWADDVDQSEYENAFNRIQSLKDDLAEVRLEGDEFVTEMKGKPFLFLISRFSRVYFYPYSSSSVPAVDEPDEEKRFALIKSPSKFFCNIDKIRLVEKESNHMLANGFEKVRLELKNGMVLEFFTAESSELINVLGAHVKQMNVNKVKLVNSLKELLKLKNEKYDCGNLEHEEKLLQFWELANKNTGELLNSRRSVQWGKLGFQGSDPATDFRAMGLLGLELLIYFLTHYFDVASGIMFAEREYPFSVAGINLGHGLLNDLTLTKSEKNLERDQFVEWDNKLFTFLCRQYSHTKGKPFEEMFCVLAELVDIVWIEMEGDYMKFGAIMNEAQKRLRDILETEPLNFAEVKQLLGLKQT